MRFKTNDLAIPTPEELENRDPTAPPEERSVLLNDPSNPFSSFLENIRALIENSLEEDGQEFVVMLGVDQETGFLSMGIARQAQKQEQSNPKKYKSIV